MTSFNFVERGMPNSENYRMFMLNENQPISPMHDIPFVVDADKHIYNAIVLGPRWSNAKMQVATGESLNPIRQSYKNQKLEYVANCFPHHGYIWNCCILPQTWKNPTFIDQATGIRGDNLPLEAIEIGYRVAKLGEVMEVKLLGTIALKGETNWRIFVMDVNDPMASAINDIADIVTNFPGLIVATLEWLRVCSIADGKVDNGKLYTADVQGVTFAKNLTKQYHDFWNELIKNEGPSKEVSCIHTTAINTLYHIDSPSAMSIIEQSPPLSKPLPIDEIMHKWHYDQVK